jgi:hypothetical protein
MHQHTARRRPCDVPPVRPHRGSHPPPSSSNRGQTQAVPMAPGDPLQLEAASSSLPLGREEQQEQQEA